MELNGTTHAIHRSMESNTILMVLGRDNPVIHTAVQRTFNNNNGILGTSKNFNNTNTTYACSRTYQKHSVKKFLKNIEKFVQRTL